MSPNRDAAPTLFLAVGFPEDGGTRFLAGKTWWRLGPDAQWTRQERQAPEGWVCSTAYADPRRGIITAGLMRSRTSKGATLCRMDAHGHELGRADIPNVDTLSFSGVAYDPHLECLVASGGMGGGPWGLMVTSEGARRIPPFSSAVYHPGLQRLVAAVDFVATPTSVSMDPAQLVSWEGDAWQPLTPRGGILWSHLFHDAALDAVTVFMQRQSGDDVLLHALRQGQLVPVTPHVRCPPSKGFRMLQTRDGVLAFGGQLFSKRRDSVFRLQAGTWMENAADGQGWQPAPPLD